VTIAGGKMFCDSEDFEPAVISALNYADYVRFLHNKQDIINPVIQKRLQEELLKQYPFFEIDNYERTLIRAVFNGDFIQAKVITNYFLIAHLMRDLKEFNEVHTNIYNILRLVLALITKNPFKIKDTRYEDLWIRLLKAESLEAMQSEITIFYNLIVEYAKSMKEFSLRSVKIQAILDYIKENYSNRLISETQICEKFNISVSCISHIFKEQVGMSFSSYIQTLRIEKVKHLLTTTDDTMNTIAQKIGYSSSDAMLKMFRRLEGLSPSQFKKDFFRVLHDK
jgi:YesN/AraC family two-component response regulator